MRGYRSAVTPGMKNVAGCCTSFNIWRIRGTPTLGPNAWWVIAIALSA